jgi:signal transduction histidine kinase
MQQQLQQAQKLKSIGTLAGGVAHDFNNILTVIIGLAQLVIKRMDRDDSNFNHLKNINESAKRAAKLTDQLLLFSRKKETEFSLVNLNAIISKLNKMLYRLIGEDISMHTDYADDLWRIRADENQIEQVITNLVVNARDAMPEGGQLTISTQNITIDEEKSKITP